MEEGAKESERGKEKEGGREGGKEIEKKRLNREVGRINRQR